MSKINIQDSNTIIIEDNKEVTDMTAITNIKDFANALANSINEMQDDYRVEVEEIVKMNDDVLYALMFKQDGSDKAPTLYANQSWDDFRAGYGVKAIAIDMLTQVKSLGPAPDVMDETFDFSFDSIKDKLSVRLIEMDRNSKFKEKVPVRALDCGLGVIADINLGNGYRTTINYKLGDEYKYDYEKLFDTALENAARMDRPKLVNMNSALFNNWNYNLLEEDGTARYWEDDNSMYVLSTESGNCGASALFYPGVLERIAEYFRVSFFILPSSIHEVIILPDTGQHAVEGLSQMVKQANGTVVQPNEVLSDNVFYYSYNNSELSIAA